MENDAKPTDYLPRTYYYAEEMFDQERARIWEKCWQLLCRQEDLAEPGSYLCASIGKCPVVVLRQLDGTVRGFHNVCVHRGAKLLEGTGRCTRRIICPYHSWSYSVDGRLIRIARPDCFPDMNQDGLHLQAIDIAHWGGFVFASLDGAREPFENRTYQFTQYLEQYAEAWSGLREIASWTYDEAVNWKVFVENYIEDYHFSSVHATSLGFYDFSRVDTAMAGEHCRITVPYATSCEESTSETPSVSYQGYMFPGTMFNADRDHVSVFRIRPESAERTFVDVILFSNPNLESRMTRTVEALKSNHHQVMSEDLFMCRGIQQTVHSEAFRPVALAGPGETAIGYFHNTLLARLAE